jgi:hypothetical protein
LLSGPLGIVLSDHTDDDGATIFRQACVMGLEGIVSKRLTAPYRSARRGIGSRSRIPTVRLWCARGRSDGERQTGQRKLMTIDAGEAAIRAVIVNALVEQGEMSGRALDALFAMRQAETIVKALGHAGYEIRRRS